MITHLKHVFIQQASSKHSNSISADVGVMPSEQVQGVQSDTVQEESYCLALHTVGHPVPPGRKELRLK